MAADQDNTTTLVVVAVVIVAAVMYSRRAAAAPAAGRARGAAPAAPPEGTSASDWIKAATGIFSGIAGLVDKFESEPDTRDTRGSERASYSGADQDEAELRSRLLSDGSEAGARQAATYGPDAYEFCLREGYDALDEAGNPTEQCLATYASAR